MKAEDLAAYFTKKIAKPIAFDIVMSENGSEVHEFYAIEPTAVNDGSLHVIVAFKYEHRYGSTMKRGTPHHCGEVEIPLRDGDTFESVLDMALAEGVYGSNSKRTTVMGDEKRLARAYAELEDRFEKEPDEHPPGPSR